MTCATLVAWPRVLLSRSRLRLGLAALPLLLTCNPGTTKLSTTPPTLVSAAWPSPPPPVVSSAPAAGGTPDVARSYGDEPGWIACGRTRCHAKKEFCCLPDPSSSYSKLEPRCVDALPGDATIPAGESLMTLKTWAEAYFDACQGDSARLCDGPGDCDPGQTCCLERAWLSDPTYAVVQACAPLVDGRPTCMHAEVCSDKDPGCIRPGASCLPHQQHFRGECIGGFRRKPDCGAGPCAEGTWCVESKGRRSCVAEKPWWPEQGIVECDQGSDCPEGLICLDSAAHNSDEVVHRCDREPASPNYVEHILCSAPSDCDSYCMRSQVPTCRRGTAPDYLKQVRGPDKGYCECHSRCKRDKDCEYDCSAATSFRGVVYPPLEGFCDRRTNVCECRKGKKKP